MTRSRVSDEGFTLAELLVVLAILAVVAPAVTGAVVLGFRTVGTTQDDVTGSAALGAFVNRFTADVHAATSVDDADPTTACPGVPGATVVHLGEDAGDVWYTFDETTRRLLRSSCGATSTPTSAVLGTIGGGVFGGDGQTTARPLVLQCGTEADPCATVRTVTVTVQLDPRAPAVAVTAVRLVSP